VGPASNTKLERSTVYVRLLDEGTEVFRPVPSIWKYGSRYLLEGKELLESNDEHWEFPPGSIVEVELKQLSGESMLVAVRMATSE
jgi:hypothetical protein